jgi:hypothetical protein
LPRDLTSVQRRARRTSGESCTWLVSVTWHRVAKGFESHGPWASDPNPIWTGDTDVPCTLGSHQICARTFSSSLHPAWAFQFAPITQAVAQRKAESYTTVPLKKWQPNTIVLVAAPNQIMPDLTQQWRLGDVWLAAIPCHAAVMAATVMASVCRLCWIPPQLWRPYHLPPRHNFGDRVTPGMACYGGAPNKPLVHHWPPQNAWCVSLSCLHPIQWTNCIGYSIHPKK